MMIGGASLTAIAGALLSGVAALATLGFASAGTAEARPAAPMPLGGWPGCPAEGNGPCHWFPGGNVAQNIFKGEVPPPPAIISTREQCLAILGPVFCPGG